MAFRLLAEKEAKVRAERDRLREELENALGAERAIAEEANRLREAIAAHRRVSEGVGTVRVADAESATIAAVKHQADAVLWEGAMTERQSA
jgi:hypothetical protein